MFCVKLIKYNNLCYTNIFNVFCVCIYLSNNTYKQYRNVAMTNNS